MATRFSQLFWGLLLVVLHLKINGFDLLVDGVGYLIIAAGCHGLSGYSPRFATARVLCFALAILWLIGLVVSGDAAIGYSLIITALNCAMIWNLLGGIADMALSQQRLDLAQRASSRRLAYVVIMAVTTALGFARVGSRDAAPLAVVLLVGMFVVIAMILHLIHLAKVELTT
jgi:hypothetical protein